MRVPTLVRIPAGVSPCLRSRSWSSPRLCPALVGWGNSCRVSVWLLPHQALLQNLKSRALDTPLRWSSPGKPTPTTTASKTGSQSTWELRREFKMRISYFYREQSREHLKITFSKERCDWRHWCCGEGGERRNGLEDLSRDHLQNGAVTVCFRTRDLR